MFSKIIEEQLENAFSTEKIELVAIQLFDQSLDIISGYCWQYYYEELVIDNIMFCANCDENEIMDKLADIFCETQCTKKIKINFRELNEQCYVDFLIKILAANFIEELTLLSTNNLLDNLSLLIKNNATLKRINVDDCIDHHRQIGEIILANHHINCIDITHDEFVDKTTWNETNIYTCDECNPPNYFFEQLYQQILKGRAIKQLSIVMCNNGKYNVEQKTIIKMIGELLKNNHLTKLYIENKKIIIPWNLLNNNWSLVECNINGKEYVNLIKKNITYKKLILHFLCALKKRKYSTDTNLSLDIKLFVEDKYILPKFIIFKIIGMMNKNSIIYE